MTEADSALTNEQLMKLGLIGLVILIFFSASFAWIWYYFWVLGNGGVGVAIAFIPLCLLPYFIVIPGYVALFAAAFAKGKWKYPVFWGMGGFFVTALFSVVLPMLLSSIFLGLNPAIFTFIAPLLSTLTIVLFISIREKA